MPNFDHLAFADGMLRFLRKPFNCLFSFSFIGRSVEWVGGEKRSKINWEASAGDGQSGGGQVCYFYVLLLTAHGGAWWPSTGPCGGWPRQLGRHSMDGHCQLLWAQTSAAINKFEFHD